MAGAEGLGAALGDGIAGGQLLQFLVCIADLHRSIFQTSAYRLHEIVADGFLDDNDDGFETGLMSIVNRVVQDGFALGTDRVDLLQTTVTAAHTGRHDYENRFLCHK